MIKYILKRRRLLFKQHLGLSFILAMSKPHFLNVHDCMFQPNKISSKYMSETAKNSLLDSLEYVIIGTEGTIQNMHCKVTKKKPHRGNVTFTREIIS